MQLIILVLVMASLPLTSLFEGPDAEPRSLPQARYYPNCDAARSAGAAPLLAGEPGYRGELDRDGDGVACEPLPTS